MERPEKYIILLIVHFSSLFYEANLKPYIPKAEDPETALVVFCELCVIIANTYKCHICVILY